METIEGTFLKKKCKTISQNLRKTVEQDFGELAEHKPRIIKIHKYSKTEILSSAS